ncbi:OmpA family protein [Paracoccus sp. NGMCC 1.201697]|uniref:OmpA family protein n=1 Tax=Paracoccus broussonetiae subsp. drimophilus TaxID=3373869 RepID=A0ABW7LJ52_9RHOB
MANRRTRRGPAVVASLIAIAAAGGLSFVGARAAADFIETHSATEVAAALKHGGYDWATVTTDGLLVRLTGTAPDEVQRFRAKSRAESVVEPDRVIDEIQVAARESMGAPQFEIELLRNDHGISIVGLVPAALDRKAMVASLRAGAAGGEISDLVETADYPAPDGWQAAFDYGLRAAKLAHQAKVSIAPGSVEVRAITDSALEKADLETALEKSRPAGISLKADVTAPRPVITPFTLRFVKDDKGARFEACAANDEAGRDRIVAAGAGAGVAGEAHCTLGLGAPTTRWADAAVPAIQAVATLGAGAVTLTDTQITLFAPASVPPATYDAAVAKLDAALPALFNLRAEHEKQIEPIRGPAEFSAVIANDHVELRGRIGNERMRGAVDSLASSRFGDVDNGLRIDPSLPEGWTLRTIAAIEALATLDQGSVSVTPDLIRLSGISGSPTASDMAVARLSQRLGAGARYELSIRYDKRLDPLLAVPTGEECVDRLNSVMSQSEIGFEPGKSIIAGDPEPTLAGISAAMQDCADYKIELAGHTDSQGSEDMNAKLSRDRAKAVMDAIRAHGVPAPHMTSTGYGESRPIADNETEAGREANRRIEFTLLSEEPVSDDDISAPEQFAGITDSAEVTAAKIARSAAAAASGAIRVALEGPVAADAGHPGGPTGAEVIVAAATAPANAVANAQVSIQVIEALTVPALEAAFPDNMEGVAESDGQDGETADIPVEDLPKIEPMGPPDVEAAVKADKK